MTKQEWENFAHRWKLYEGDFKEGVVMPLVGCSGALVLLFGVAFVLLTVPKWVNSMGWISHSEETAITAEGNWLVGESKECTSYPSLNEKLAAATGKENQIGPVHCDSGPAHEITVTFWGRVHQPEYDAITWKCTREQTGFTCRELWGHRANSDATP